MIRCARCDEPAPLPPHVHAQHANPGGDPELPLVFPVPQRWYPTAEGDGIVCLACASDDEINEWVTSPGFAPDYPPADDEW